ncbi:MAG: WcbI family polysaccharide biosynthesis putative acetyltransferase [Lapillicoccus sp.]
MTFPSTLPAGALADLPRARHYGQFYGLAPLPEDGPLLVVHGNCQAEALRVLLDGAPRSPCTSVRVPALHEIAADEMPLLARLLDRADVLLTQPVAGGYHGLPLGTADVRRAASRARTVVFPIVRFVGLHPYQVVTSAPELRPPEVPYHDLRTVLRASGAAPAPTLDAERLEATTAWSLRALRLREEAAGAVPVHDLLRAAGTRAANTINHPGNPVLLGLARRLQRTLGWPETAEDPGRELLDSVHAPLEEQVCRLLPQGDGTVRPDWVVDGEALPDARVVAAQLAWYLDHPDVVRVVLNRASEQLRHLGRRPDAR